MATSKPQHPEWAKPGERAVVVVTRNGRDETVVTDKIERLTPTLLVTEAGRRFTPSGGEEYISSTRGDYRDRLFAWDSDDGVRARSRAVVRNRIRALTQAVKDQTEDPFNVENAQRLVELSQAVQDAATAYSQIR